MSRRSRRTTRAGKSEKHAKSPRQLGLAGTAHNAPPRNGSDALQSFEFATRLLELNRLEEAMAAYRQALALKPDFPEAHYSLGNCLLKLNRMEEAATAYRQAVALRPHFPEAHNNLGHVLLTLRRPEEARDALRAAVSARDTFWEALYNLGNALMELERYEESADIYRRAIVQKPAFPEAHFNLANVLLKLQRPEEAAASYRHALTLRPDYAEAQNNLGEALSAQGRYTEAIQAFGAAVATRDDVPQFHYNYANMLLRLERHEEAVESYRRAISLWPSFAEAYNYLGSTLLLLGRSEEAAAVYRHMIAAWPENSDAYRALGNVLLLRNWLDDEALEMFRHAARLQPLSKRHGNSAKPDFQVLLVNAPGFANTPNEYLVGRAAYDSNFVMLLENIDYDIAMLRANGEVVVNLISDVDWGSDVLHQAAELIDRIGRPVINHPLKIMATGRDDIAQRLVGISRCRMPKTIHLSGSALIDNLQAALADFSFPLLMRLCGSHGGVEFEKLTDHDAVAAFVGRAPEADYYVTEYVPYESADGYFRKYRLIFTDGEIFPYHLAIADQWKVHHFRTDMANHAWMRAEEEAFLKNPWSVFGDEHQDALHTIQALIGLDYFGIDCALDHRGDLLVFEVNASMLVHGERGIFAYKEPYIARIKHAFDAMLAKAARGSRPLQGT